MDIPEYVKEEEKAQQIYLDALRKQGWTFGKFVYYLAQHMDTSSFDQETLIDLYNSCAIAIMQTEINDVESWVAYQIKTNNELNIVEENIIGIKRNSDRYFTYKTDDTDFVFNENTIQLVDKKTRKVIHTYRKKSIINVTDGQTVFLSPWS